MAKAKKAALNKVTTKTAKEASNVFHNIMAASVQGNPKPTKNKKKAAKK